MLVLGIELNDLDEQEANIRIFTSTLNKNHIIKCKMSNEEPDLSTSEKYLKVIMDYIEHHELAT